ncbi:MAG: hypothetical protein K6E29_04730 [Cyanobacteria bacterium RUI128]|nr:hypothetical protein [Cyanobacteria bacterium RUI128]
MGFNFNAGDLIGKLSNASAKVSKGKEFNDSTIDTKEELFTFMTGVDGIKNQAKVHNADISEAEIEAMAKAELNEVLDFNFGTKEVGIEDKDNSGFFNDDEISLDALMGYLDENIEVTDKAKIEKYNELGVVANDPELKAVDTLADAGFDSDLINILVNDESIAGSVRYIVKDILSGSAERIGAESNEDTAYAESPEDMETLGQVKQSADYERYAMA